VKANPAGVVVWVILACGGGAVPGASPSPSPLEAAPSVEVHQETLLISFPAQAGADLTWPGQRLPAGYPGPEWRAMIRAGEAWLLVVSLQLIQDSAKSIGPYASTSEALRDAHLRECSLGRHTISCSKSLKGNAMIEGKELVLRIRDQSLITRLQANRHLQPSARLNFRRNQQDIVWQGIVYLEFQ
jgi:hypothetical protein